MREIHRKGNNMESLGWVLVGLHGTQDRFCPQFKTIQSSRRRYPTERFMDSLHIEMDFICILRANTA